MSPSALSKRPKPLTLLFSVLAAVSLAACVATPTVVPATSTPLPAPPSATPLPPTTAPTDVPPTDVPPTDLPPTDVPPTDAPTAVPATETPAAPEVPEAILITSPGLSSQLTSPLHIEGFAEPTFEQNLVIQITDENGAVLAIQPTTIQADAGSAGPFSADVAFTVPSDQPGRISVYTASARDGGLEHLASVEVDLLASGTAVINPAEEHDEVHMILEPAPLASISGGTLHLEGYSDYVFEATLNVWLCGEGGSGVAEPICGTADNVLAMDFTMIQASDIGFDGPFTLDLAYSVSATTQARLVVYSTSARDGGLLHVTTIPVTLNP